MLPLLLSALLTQSGILADGACDGVVTVEQVEGAILLGECSASNGQHRMALTVVNTRGRSVGTLNIVHVGFCASSVIRASAPPGWVVKLDDEGGGVTFARGDDPFSGLGVKSGRRLGGFVLELRQGWRYARSAAVSWELAGAARGISDVC